MTARPEFGDAIAVTQADADAAADLIERYFPTNSGMLSLAGSFRRGHLQGVWPYAFACHRTSTALPLAHPAAPQGEVMAWHYQRPNKGYPKLPDHVVVEPAVHRWSDATGWVETPLYALAPAAIASGREGAE